MAWKTYPVFDEIPSFDPPPVMGLGEISRGNVNLGQAETFVRWNGTTGLAFGFRYLTQSREEWRRLRDDITAARGSGAVFYLPTWQPDFSIVNDAAASDVQIKVLDGGFSALTEDFPDTEGRIVFFTKPDGSFQINRVTAAADDGANEDVFLEDPLDFALDASVDIMGLCYLCRLAEDQVSFEAYQPGRGFVDLRFLTVRTTRNVDTVETVESEAP